MWQEMGDGQTSLQDARVGGSSGCGFQNSRAVLEVFGEEEEDPTVVLPIQASPSSHLFSPASGPASAPRTRDSPAPVPVSVTERQSNSPYAPSTTEYSQRFSQPPEGAKEVSRQAHEETVSTQKVLLPDSRRSSARRPRPCTPPPADKMEAYTAFVKQQTERERQACELREAQERETAATDQATRAAASAGIPAATATAPHTVTPNNATRYNSAGATAASLSMAGTPQVDPATGTTDSPNGAAARSGPNTHYSASGLPVNTGPKKALGKFTRVCCLTVSHQWYHCLFLVVIVLLFGLIFLTSVVPRGEVYSYVIGGVFMFLSLACLFLCVCIDPGIVPPAPRDKAPTHSEFVTVHGVEVECKPCRTCHVIRPPRSTHCQFSDVCVEEFDHFCPIVGACVAKRTYRFFAGFFIVTMVLCFYIFIRSILVLYQVRDTFTESTGQRWQFAAGILCILASFFGGCFVIPFSFMYITMACLNTTQKESMRTMSDIRRQQQQAAGSPNQFGLGAKSSHDGDAIERPPTPPCGGQFLRNKPYSTNLCLDCLKRFFGPLGTSKMEKDYYV